MRWEKVEAIKTKDHFSSSEYYLAPDVKAAFDKSKHIVIKGNQDRVYCIDGREGSGKSTLALQFAHYLDPHFSINKIVFKAEDFENVIREVPKYSAVVFDEAFNGLSSKGALSQQNKKMIRLLMECRQRNLFVFIVLPSIFLLEKYVAVFRSQCLFHVYAAQGYINRRYYKLYNYSDKKILYIKGKPLMDYRYPRIRMTYRFYGKTPMSVDQDLYVKKKLEAFRDRELPGKQVARELEQRYLLMKKLHEDGLSFRAIGRICGMTHNSVSTIISNGSPMENG